MVSPQTVSSLPDSRSPDLFLSHPTANECIEVCNNAAASWKDSLTVSAFLEECDFLTTVPLAKNGGMTSWILVDKNLPPDQRTILCSCETFRKRSLVSDSDGNGSDTIVHGIASVFCPQSCRGRGYASRMMTELAKVLHSWQSENMTCIGSILYSDIGKAYYAKLGWHPDEQNTHVSLQPFKYDSKDHAVSISKDELEDLCKADEAIIRKAMAIPAEGVKTRMSIIPDVDHMLWHIAKEEFACRLLFHKVPQAKGATIGPPGSRVWIIWTHRYYSHPGTESRDNTLYVLRIVVENSHLPKCTNSGDKNIVQNPKFDEQVGYLKAVLQAAQTEAAEWSLDQVKLWNPTPKIYDLIVRSELEHLVVEREEDSIASGFWYDADGNKTMAPQWINNEHYAWC